MHFVNEFMNSFKLYTCTTGLNCNMFSLKLTLSKEKSLQNTLCSFLKPRTTPKKVQKPSNTIIDVTQCPWEIMTSGLPKYPNLIKFPDWNEFFVVGV